MSKEVTKEELLEAISSGFTSIEERFQEVDAQFEKAEKALLTKADLKKTEKRLGVKIDGISNRLDAEITRRTDEYARHGKRITALEVETGLAEI